MARLLIIDDDPRICRFLCELAEDWGHAAETALCMEDGRRIADRRAFDLVLLDLDLPDGHGLSLLPSLVRSPGQPEVIIVTGTGDIRGAELAFRHGAWDFVQKPFTAEEVRLPVVRALAYRAERQSPRTPRALDRTGIVGESQAIAGCLEDLARAAASDASVLVTGETGSGKELFARAIHRNSTRREAAFVPIDCGGIPETLAESLFFGHEKGAFTGADAPRDGVVRQAAAGTLFLDEIGDLPLGIQKALLRALQEKRIRPLGAGGEIAVDFRLVAATHRDLKQMVAERRFREDLLFRIGAIRIALPPLRGRGRDIREITRRKVEQICDHYGREAPGLSADFLEVLAAQSWPGNVRELINVIEYALASAGADPTLYPKHLPPEYRTVFMAGEDGFASSGPGAGKTAGPPAAGDAFPTLRTHRTQAERRYLQDLVLRAGGNRERACRLSGISQARLYSLLKKYGLSLLKP